MAAGDRHSHLVKLGSIAGGAVVCAGLARLCLKHQRHRCLPRGFKKGRFTTEKPKRSEDAKVERDGYTSKKAQIEDLDAIVIGSGLGGLTCAGILSRCGWRVLVLEQHYIAGGCTHVFEDKGFEFDTGLHYVGNIVKRQKYFDLVCCDSLVWDQMGSTQDGFVYDEIVVGPNGRETSVKFPSGRDAFVGSLEKTFPGCTEVVNCWLDRLQKITKSDIFIELKVVRPKILAYVLNCFVSGSFFKWMRRGINEEAQALVSDTRLRSILLGQFGNYCARPGLARAYTHATVAMHYLGGGWYPRGGSSEIARKMIPTIERSGGRVLVRKAVQQILVENGRACGVLMDNGDVIKAPRIISACGAQNTWQKLLPPGSVPQSILDKIQKVGPSASIMYCFIGIDGDTNELNLPSCNIWRWPTADDHDLDRMIQAFQEDPEHAPVPLFCGFPSSKDKSFATRYPGKSTAVLLTLGDPRWFTKWEGTKWGKRGKDYEEWKARLTKRIVEEGLYHMWPQTKGRVEYTSLGTSLTYNHFIGSISGECYGLDFQRDRCQANDWLRPESPIPGLYLTGQDVAVFGIAGALMSGVLSSMAILGYGSLLDLVSGRNVVEDLWHLDASEKSGYSERSAEHYATIYGRPPPSPS